MTDAPAAKSGQYGPWNPGIESQLPRELLPLSTIFRPENVYTRVTDALELRDLTGLELDELVAFRPERLVLHELMIRVLADLSVPDGRKVEDLGINFRRMTSDILSRHVEPHMEEIAAAFGHIRSRMAQLIDAELARAYTPASEQSPGPAGERRSGGFLGLFRRRQSVASPSPPEDPQAREERLIAEWDASAHAAADGLQRAACRALFRVVSAVRARHGRLWGDRTVLASLATDMACNAHASEIIGGLIEPHLRVAVQAEGYRLLPPQENPVVMNTKGASASGKSTMRPLQKRLAADIGVHWSDFALISPDIWRKQLLDYGSLGAAYRYAGTFTGHELKIIDQKFDRYMSRKSAGAMPHLLIDRFRFDSFAAESEEAGSNLLTRFGHTVYMFFMITPPHSTVERAWKRGLDVGRYKAVDDVLAHNVEAYTGMPDLFFTWAMRRDKRVRYEFLDNSVAPGERPRTAAFGRDGEFNVLDVKCMLDIDRYRKIDVNATRPEQVYRDAATMAPEANTGFLAQCARKLPVLSFADWATGRVYLRIRKGSLEWADPDGLREAIRNPDTHAGIRAVAPDALDAAPPASQQPVELSPGGDTHTLGRWGVAPESLERSPIAGTGQ